MNQPKYQTDDKESINADQVYNYLMEHSDFFVDNTEILELLKIPHPSGQAVSLVSKQLEVFRGKNEKLLQQLNVLVQIARDNDDLFRKMHHLTMALMDANDLENALASLESVLHEYFQADFVTIRILKSVANPTIINLFIDPEDNKLEPFKKILDSGRPKCGQPNSDQASFLFGENAAKTQSCAIVPIASPNLTGLLAIGSVDEEKFLPTMGHMFLTQMGELIGLRLDTLIEVSD